MELIKWKQSVKLKTEKKKDRTHDILVQTLYVGKGRYYSNNFLFVSASF